MLLYEFRIPLPFSTSEYKIAQLYTVAEMSQRATGGGEGVEILKNEPFSDFPLRIQSYDSGTYTYKIYHMESKIPSFIRLLSEPGKFDVHEEAWNAFPFCRTYLTNPGYMKENFFIDIESMHIDDDRGESDNALQLSPEQLKMRKVVNIDIGNDQFTGQVDIANDPSEFASKCGRGPLRDNWIETVRPVMTAYKVVKVEFKFFGLQKRVEQLVQMNEHRLFTQFHRQMFCWMDSWMGMSLDDVRKMEANVHDRLTRNMASTAGGSSYVPTDLYDSKTTCVLNK